MTSLCSICHSKPSEVSCPCLFPAPVFCAGCYTDHCNASEGPHSAKALDRHPLSPRLESKYQMLERYSAALKELEQLTKTQVRQAQRLAGELENESERKSEAILVKELDVACEVLGRGLSTAYQAAASAIELMGIADVPMKIRQDLAESTEKIIRMEEERNRLKRDLQAKLGIGEEEKASVETLRKDCAESDNNSFTRDWLAFLGLSRAEGSKCKADSASRQSGERVWEAKRGAGPGAGKDAGTQSKDAVLRA